MSFQKLPDELLALALSFVEKKHLPALALVNKQMGRVVASQLYRSVVWTEADPFADYRGQVNAFRQTKFRDGSSSVIYNLEKFVSTLANSWKLQRLVITAAFQEQFYASQFDTQGPSPEHQILATALRMLSESETLSQLHLAASSTKYFRACQSRVTSLDLHLHRQMFPHWRRSSVPQCLYDIFKLPFLKHLNIGDETSYLMVPLEWRPDISWQSKFSAVESLSINYQHDSSSPHNFVQLIPHILNWPKTLKALYLDVGRDYMSGLDASSLGYCQKDSLEKLVIFGNEHAGSHATKCKLKPLGDFIALKTLGIPVSDVITCNTTYPMNSPWTMCVGDDDICLAEFLPSSIEEIFIQTSQFQWRPRVRVSYPEYEKTASDLTRTVLAAVATVHHTQVVDILSGFLSGTIVERVINELPLGTILHDYFRGSTLSKQGSWVHRMLSELCRHKTSLSQYPKLRKVTIWEEYNAVAGKNPYSYSADDSIVNDILARCEDAGVKVNFCIRHSNWQEMEDHKIAELSIF